MKTIQEIVNDKVASMVSDNTIQNAIEEGVQSAITSAISSQFKSYGSITKQIEKSIEDGLKINTNDLAFETYNEQMLVIIKQKLGDMFKGEASEKFITEIEKVLDPAPAELSVTELIEKIVSLWKTDAPYDSDNLDEYATVELEPWKYDEKDYHLKMWKQKESTGYSARQNIEDLNLFIANGAIRISHKQSYNPTCFHEHEAFVFKLYSAGTKITGIDSFDIDDCDLTLKDLDY